jgi:type III restriction enzyme
VSAVRIKFDPDQAFQVEAVEAAIGVFKGQPLTSIRNEMADLGVQGGSLFNEFGIGNKLTLSDEQVAANLTAVQEANDIPEDSRGGEFSRDTADFTVEMETGTGKTYVYLRTIFEMNRVYGWTKFVIVVPSIAIREGVEASIRLLNDHFDALYEGVTYDAETYDSAAPARVRNFATSDYLQILVMNIDAFKRADTNKIYQAQDEMMGHKPVDFIRSTSPVLILDEPQNMESEASRNALATLNPLFTLRYSATHLDTRHQIYRLTPADAYNLGLVKQIDVWSVIQDEDANRPHIRLVKVNRGKRTISARVELDCAATSGIKRKTVTVNVEDKADLARVSGRSAYDGYVITLIEPNAVELGNGVRLALDESYGVSREQIQRVQISTAIRRHLDRELNLLERSEAGEIAPTKALALFFIDKVDNYWPTDGRLRLAFEEEYERLSSQPRYEVLNLPPANEVHDGYFARDREGAAKDTRGVTKDDKKAYELIMRDKESLLSTDEPLRFIFSHSALREGWDNPNVFTIATLAESHSELKKRQEIGRGLRLPVMSDGKRCRLRDVAVLTVVANESYDEFAERLQTEIEEETGSEFANRSVRDGRTRREISLREGYEVNPAFIELWDHISRRTDYQVEFDSTAVAQSAAMKLKDAPELSPVFVRTAGARIEIDQEEGVEAVPTAQAAAVAVEEEYVIPDLVGHVMLGTGLSRGTIGEVLRNSGRLEEAKINPQQFIDQTIESIESAKAEQLVEGIVFTRRPDGTDSVYEASNFAERTLTGYDDNLVAVEKSIYTDVVYDSDLERRIALALDLREDIQLFMKLPGWFVVDTPIGTYNPDWAMVKTESDGSERLYLIRESKPTRNLDELRPIEKLKIQLAEKHFEAIEVDYGVVSEPDQV